LFHLFQLLLYQKKRKYTSEAFHLAKCNAIIDRVCNIQCLSLFISHGAHGDTGEKRGQARKNDFTLSLSFHLWYYYLLFFKGQEYIVNADKGVDFCWDDLLHYILMRNVTQVQNFMF
jgi:hypothetical protein